MSSERGASYERRKHELELRRSERDLRSLQLTLSWKSERPMI